VRTIESTATFMHPFTLGDDEEVFPAGEFRVETVEERLEGLSFNAYRKLRALIHLPAASEDSGLPRILTTDPGLLAEALKRDGVSPPAKLEPLSVRVPGAERSKRHQRDIDNRALERAENEGMAPQP